MINEYRSMNEDEKRVSTQSCERLRLMVSGSMALPEVFNVMMHYLMKTKMNDNNV
jgi:hypothetical protein